MCAGSVEAKVLVLSVALGGLDSLVVDCTVDPVFSPAYLKDSGPLPLQYWFYFDVGLGRSQWL